MLGILLLRYPIRDVLRASRARSKVKRIPDGELRKVVINFRCVDCLAAVDRLHLLCSNTSIVQSSSVAYIKTMGVSRDGSQQGRTTGTWRSEDAEHLPLV